MGCPVRKLTIMKNILYWLPRILAILFIIFISLFALDVFGKPNWFLALLIHLIPSFILIIATIVAWKKELVGGLVFVVLGLSFILYFHNFVISAPVFIIGILFVIHHFYFGKFRGKKLS